MFARRAGVKLLEEERRERRRLRAAPLQPLSDPGGCCCRWICQVRQIDFYRANRIREIERAIALAATPAKALSLLVAVMEEGDELAGVFPISLRLDMPALLRRVI